MATEVFPEFALGTWKIMYISSQMYDLNFGFLSPWVIQAVVLKNLTIEER